MNNITAVTEYPINEMIAKRWSPRSFSSKQIPDAELKSLFEAAHWSFSSMNEQPWKYLFAYNGEHAFDRMIECLMSGNQPWAKNASVIILSIANRLFSNDKINRHAFHDVGAANMNLLLEAADRNIYGHLMGGFDVDHTREEFKLSEDEEPVVFIAVGYLDDPEKLPEPFRKREVLPRSRKKIEEFIQHID
jgi:nitroreductase